MDLQKEKIAHEKHLLSQGVDFKYLPNIQYSELENVYELIEWDEEYSEALNEINSSWCTWQAAKAQAVPEGFVLVPEDQAKDTDRLNFLLGGEEYIRTVIHRDIQNDECEKIGEHFQLTEVFWIDGFYFLENTSSDSERGAIDKAMIEAQEPTND